MHFTGLTQPSLSSASELPITRHPCSPPPARVTQFRDLSHTGIYNSILFPVLAGFLEVFSLKSILHGSLGTDCSMFLALLVLCPLPALPLCHQPAGIFRLPGTPHQCPGKQQENSKKHVGTLFFFLVLTTPGKNLDENRGATGMIEEGFFCVVFFLR